jgi:retinol-binding protein 3
MFSTPSLRQVSPRIPIRFATVALIFAFASAFSVAHAQSRQMQTQATGAPQFDSAARAEVAEKFAQDLTDDYAYADKGAAMAAAIRAKLNAKAYDTMNSPMEFATALERDARSVTDDRHIMVGFSFGPMRMMMRSGPPSPEMLAQMRRENAAVPEVKILDGNIGYIAVTGMLPDPAAKDAIAAAFAFLANTDALILDLRGNPGGNGSIDLYMSYLSSGAPYLLDTVHWRDGRVMETRTTDLANLSYGNKKPVFVLTSHWTFSAAEALAYDIKSFKRGVIVGETTGGGANPSAGGGMVPLGHGFFARIPTGYVVNAATGTNWEGVGVKPDVDVPADQALDKAWSLALAGLSANAPNPQSRALLAALSSAKLDGDATLANSDLVGTYAPQFGGPPMIITESGGKLYEQRRGAGESADIPLRRIAGDRYAPVGFPDGFSLTFVKSNGSVNLVLVQPPTPPSLLEKR